MRALLYWVACASTLGCVRLYIKLCALLYWVACASILVACASILGSCASISGCVRYYIWLYTPR